MRIKYNKGVEGVEGKNAWLDANALEDSPSLPLLLQLLQVQLVLPYGTGDQALLAMAAALYESNIMLLPTIEPGTVQVRYDATAAASLFADAPSGEVGIVWIEASKLDTPQSLSLDTPEATYYPLQLQSDSMSFKGLPYRHYMDDSMEVADKTVLYYCRCYFRASSTAEPLYDTVHSFSVQGLADNAYVYDRRYAADPFVLYPWLSDEFREAHGIGPIGYIAVEDTYSSRQTADGADIIDGALETVKKIQGATVKTTNLIPFPYDGTENLNGATFTVNDDGSITVNKPTANEMTSSYYLILQSGFNLVAGNTYTLSGGSGNAIVVISYTEDGTDKYFISDSSAINFTWSENYIFKSMYVHIYANRTVNNVTVYPMLNEGSSALPYMPYFPGLKNAYFKGLRSTGRNLVDQSSLLVGYYKDSDFGIDDLQLFRSIKVYLSVGTYTLQSAVEFHIVRTVIDGEYSVVGISGTAYTFTTTTAGYVGISFRRSDNTNWVDGTNLMLNYGSSALPYEPYISHEISLDTAIELPAWDSINPTTGKRIVGTNTVYLDEIDDWTVSPNEYEGKTSFSAGIYPNIVVYNSQNPKAICSRLPFSYPTATNKSAGEAWAIANSTNRIYVSIFNSRLSSLDSAGLKAYFTQERNAGNPYVVSFIVATTESDIEMEDRLPAYKNGSETVIQGDTDNSEYGAENTLTQEYYNLEVNDNE